MRSSIASAGAAAVADAIRWKAAPCAVASIRRSRLMSVAAASSATSAKRAASPSHAARWAWTNNMARSEEHTSELQSLMRISYAVFCLKKQKKKHKNKNEVQYT